MKALVLAAGNGTRLGKLTEHTPKCLVEVAGRPVIDHVLWQLYQYDITNVMVNVHHHADMVMCYLGDRVTYFYEPTLLNTAGTVKAVADWFDEDILVVNADTITNANYDKLLQTHKDELMDVTVLSKDDKCAGAYVIYKEFAKKDLEVGKKVDGCIAGHAFYYEQPALVYHDIGTPGELAIARKYYEKIS